jgi:hypothetical protein
MGYARMKVFICYSRHDEGAVRPLVADLQRARVQVWLDESLRGGDDWWTEILAQIRDCTVFLFALSDNSLASKPCRADVGYAEALSLPILPVQVGEVSSYRSNPIFSRQLIDYRKPDARTGMELIAALHALVADRKPLPDPLPTPPPIPYAYLQSSGAAINSPKDLSPSAQSKLVLELRTALSEEDDPIVRDAIRELLGAMRVRGDVTYRTLTEIDAALDAGAREFARRPEFNDLGPGGDAASRSRAQSPTASGPPRSESVEPPPAETLRSAAPFERRPLSPVSPTPAVVFVSFSEAEADVAADVVDAFSDRSVGCFYAPRDIHTGLNYGREIVRAIRGCQVLVLLLSPAALRSQHVRREVTIAIEHEKVILPFSLGGLRYPQDITTEEDWIYWLSAVQVSEYASPVQTAAVASNFVEPASPSAPSSG